jgi:hypothetical protein
MVEARSEITAREGGIAVDGVLASGRWCGDMCLVENEKTLPRPRAKVSKKRIAVLGAPKDLMRDDETVVRAPWIDAKPALLTPTCHELLVHDFEVEPKAPLHLIPPLKADRGRTRDERKVDLLSKQQFLEDKSGLNRLTEPNVIRNEQVRARQLKGFHQRRELVHHELDARPERRLETCRIGRTNCAPL